MAYVRTWFSPLHTVVETPEFLAGARRVLTEGERAALIDFLADNPETGDLMEGTNSVRGILIAGDFSPRAIAAARVVPNIKLVRYGFRFSFETISHRIASAAPG